MFNVRHRSSSKELDFHHARDRLHALEGLLLATLGR